MKYIKLFILLAVVAFMGSCSDDESWNSQSGVTVSMENTAMKFKENLGIVNIPIKVEGETNGTVRVKVGVKETGANPAKENEHYYITSKTININDGSGYVELECVDDEVINDDRTFEITIVSAQGATVGANATTAVTLRDNDKEVYERLQGKWTMTGVDLKGNAVSWDVKIVGASDETDKEYNHTLYVTGMAGIASSSAILSFTFDPETNDGHVSFDHLGDYNFCEGLNFGMANPMNLLLLQFDGKSLFATPLDGTWSADLKTITFDEEGTLTAFLVDSKTGEQPGYVYMGNDVSGGITKIKMVKK